MPFFKPKDEVARKKSEDAYVKGIDQKNWKVARKAFEKAYNNFQKVNDQKNAQLNFALWKLMEAAEDQNNPDKWMKAYEAFTALGDQSVKLISGPDVSASKLAMECKLRSHVIKVKTFPNTSDKLKYYKFISEKYYQIGQEELILSRMFEEGDNKTGQYRAEFYQAMYYETWGADIVYSDPIKAAENYQQAMNIWDRLKKHEQKAKDMQKMNDLKKGAKCWFCGREIFGMHVHIKMMPTMVTTHQKSAIGKGVLESPLKSADNAGKHIFACLACFDAIWNQADERGRFYYNEALKALEALRDEVTAYIDRLDGRLRVVESMAHYPG